MLLILLTLPSRDLVWTVSVFQYAHNNHLGWHSNNTRGPLVYKLQLLPPIINQSCYLWCLVHNYTAILSVSENEIFLKLRRTFFKSTFDSGFIETTGYIFKINHMCPACLKSSERTRYHCSGPWECTSLLLFNTLTLALPTSTLLRLCLSFLFDTV